MLRILLVFLREFTEPILRLSIADQVGLDAWIEQVYERVEARLIANPEDYFNGKTEKTKRLIRLKRTSSHGSRGS